MSLHEYTVGDVITLTRRPITLNPDSVYREIGLRSFGRGVFHKDVIRGDKIGNKKVFRISPGDLLFSNIFAWEGAVALAADNEEGLIGSHRFMTYQVDESVADPRYILHYFASGPGLEVIRASSPGSAGRNRTLGIKSFAAQVIRIPDKIGQQRIADKLDALLGRVDAAHALRANFSRLQGSVNESLVSRVSEEAVETVQLGNVLTFARTPITIDADSTYRTIGVRSFGKGFIRHPPTKGENLSKLNYFRFRAGALALSNLMAWEGGITVTRPEDTPYIASNRFFFYLPTDDRVNASFLRHFLLSRRGQALIGSACSAGAERNRTPGRKRFEALEIPLPPRAEQDKVARILDSFAERVSKVHADPALDALRPSILNAAFTGQL
ncbi:MAG: restriction endonuclease subunit S [Pseudonocardiaceae bacterium]